VVVLIEDVHWAEPPLLELLERVARHVTGPLLLLVTGRPDFARAWDPRIDSEAIWLEPLPAETSAALVAGCSRPTCRRRCATSSSTVPREIPSSARPAISSPEADPRRDRLRGEQDPHARDRRVLAFAVVLTIWEISGSVTS